MAEKVTGSAGRRLPVWLLWAGLAVTPAQCLRAEPVAVRIEGLEPRLEQNVRALLSIEGEASDAEPARIQSAHQRAVEQIRTALEPFGYYRPTIDTSLHREARRWVAIYRVDAGPAIRLATVDVRLTGEARDIPEIQGLVGNFPLKSGDVLDHAKYEKGKSAFQEAAAEFGFFKADFTRREILVNLDLYRADIHLHFASGKRSRFGPVTFSPTPLSPSLLHRFVDFEPGQPYRASQLITLQRRLFDSGYFNQADVMPEPQRAENSKVPIDVELGMQPRHRFQAGAGYGTDTGPRMTLGYRNPFVNSLGHSWQGLVRLSFIKNEVSALYAIPLRRPYRDQLAFSANLGQEDTVSGTAQVFRAGVRHSSPRWGLREVLALDVHREDYTIDGGTGGITFLLIPSAAYTWLQADDPINTTRGYRIDGFAAGASRSLLSDASFLKLSTIAKGVYSLDDDNRLIGRGQAGYVFTDDFNRIPYTQRFYAGGGQSVRGYRYDEISPTNSAGDRTGGNTLIVASFEYERRLLPDWSLATFVDAGNVSLDMNAGFRFGTGLGVRWRSPVGPVRLDFAVPLSPALDPFQVYLVLGPDL